jgi:hypothetical protein
MLSPACKMLFRAMNCAAWPEPTASAATPPSSAALLKHVGGRVHQAGVDIAKLLKRKQVSAVLRILEYVAGSLVNGHGARARGGVGHLTGVQLERFEVLGLGSHEVGK